MGFYQIAMWINNNFILPEVLNSESSIQLALVALRTNKPLVLKMDQNGQFTIYSDDMELAGLIIQSLLSYLNLADLQVTCDFQEEMNSLQSALEKVNFLF